MKHDGGYDESLEECRNCEDRNQCSGVTKDSQKWNGMSVAEVLKKDLCLSEDDINKAIKACASWAEAYHPLAPCSGIVIGRRLIQEHIPRPAAQLMAMLYGGIGKTMEEMDILISGCIAVGYLYRQYKERQDSALEAIGKGL